MEKNMKKRILVGCIIAVVLLTLVSFSSVVGYNSVESNPDATPIEFEVQRIRELVQSINLRKIIANPDAVLETLEEISSILEEEDVRNYIEKTSDEDFGCEEPNEWGFPVICNTLMVIMNNMLIVVFIIGIFLMFPPNALDDILNLLLFPFMTLYELLDCPDKIIGN